MFGLDFALPAYLVPPLPGTGYFGTPLFGSSMTVAADVSPGTKHREQGDPESDTIKNIALARILPLPATMLLSGGLYVILCLVL